MKTTPSTAAPAEAEIPTRPSRRMRSKGPLQSQGPNVAPNPGGEPPDGPALQANWDTEMHEVQEEYQVHPAYQFVTTQEVLPVILMMMEEEMDLMNLMRTRLFILHDPSQTGRRS